MPPITIPSWPCMFSGQNPQQLGYYWFTHPEKGLFNSFIWRERSIFSHKDLRQLVLNVPGTYPAWNINGEMITGLLSPKISCFPKELEFKLKENWIINGKTIKDIFKAFKIKKDLFLEKIYEDYNLLTYVVRMPDSISHHTRLSQPLIQNYIYLGYKKIDDFIGQILNSGEIDNLIIFSDHGLRFYKHDFNMTRWLEKKGLIFINKSSQHKIYSLISKIYDFFRPILKIDYEKLYLFKKRFQKISKKKKSNTKKKKTDKNKIEISKAFSYNSNVGGLFLKGEDKKKEKIIIESLLKEKKIKKIISTNLKDFPSLFIVLNEKYMFNHNPSMFITKGRNAILHTQEGLFMAYGKNIKSKQFNSINYEDIAPTLLNLFNIQKPAYMTGKCLEIIK